MSERKSILCPQCRKLIGPDELTCPYCGLKRPHLHHAVGRLGKIFLNHDPVTIIIYVNIAFYLLALIIDPRSFRGSDGTFSFLAPSSYSLLLLGASGTIPVLGDHRIGTLISASFLHGGIFHIAFNMMAFYQIGPFILREFGFHRFINLYLLTGMAGFACSTLCGTPFTLGASANICGLIGAIIYYGRSRGDFYGEMIFKQAIGWVVGLVILGFIFRGIDNWAHGGGLISGILLAALMGYNDQKPESFRCRLLAYFCILLTTVVLLWSVANVFWNDDSPWTPISFEG